jgi:hypothetical protein
MQSPPSKPSALIKPTLDTRFHIDYSWWDRQGQDLRTYLISHLPPEQRERLIGNEARTVDYVDPDTGEVTRLDELQMALRLATQEPDFINPHTSVVDGIFRVFLANDNQPLTARDIAEYVGRPASVILKTLTAGRVYMGIRPTE